MMMTKLKSQHYGLKCVMSECEQFPKTDSGSEMKPAININSTKKREMNHTNKQGQIRKRCASNFKRDMKQKHTHTHTAIKQWN